MNDENHKNPVAQALNRWEKLIDQATVRLENMPELETGARPAPGKWSKKEILGHLIDSASDNHQRFVRAQLDSESTFPAYAQTLWVDAQQYQVRPWKDLVRLWAAYNAHLRHLASCIPEDKLTNSVVLDGKPLTLHFLVTDYVQHLEHHLRQILVRPGDGSDDPVLQMRGVGKEIWAEEGGDTFVAQDRSAWDDEDDKT